MRIVWPFDSISYDLYSVFIDNAHLLLLFLALEMYGSPAPQLAVEYPDGEFLLVQAGS